MYYATINSGYVWIWETTQLRVDEFIRIMYIKDDDKKLYEFNTYEDMFDWYKTIAMKVYVPEQDRYGTIGVINGFHITSLYPGEYNKLIEFYNEYKDLR
jgi:hypothetical protein